MDLDAVDLDVRNDAHDEARSDAVERTLDLDASSDQVWEAVCDPTGWLADSGWLDLRPGGRGQLTDDGVERAVAIDELEEGSRLVYRWWTRDEGPSRASRVEITVFPLEGSTRVVIRESRPMIAASASASLRWGVRSVCLAARAVASYSMV